LEQCLHRIETGGSTEARRPWEGQIAVSQLTMLAFRRDWPMWSRTLESATELLARVPGIPEDVAAMARIAGELTQAAGQEILARAAYGLADTHSATEVESRGITIVDGMLSRLPKLA